MKDLLAPRYKVIAHYPHSPYKVGDILTMNEDGSGFSVDGKSAESESILNTCKAIFKPLQWWEERTAEEMPEFVRYNKGYGPAKNGGGVFRVLRSDIINGNLVLFTDAWQMAIEIPDHPVHLTPATKEEYEAYKEKSA